MRTLVAAVALALGAMSEAHCGEERARWLSVTLPVIAILQNELFLGEAVAYLDRTGTIDVRAALAPESKCHGTFRYTAPNAGLADMRCDDGAAAKLSFNALTTFSGYGYGSTPVGPASFTFGLDAEKAASYLRLPEGKRLVRRSEGLRLEAATPDTGTPSQ